MQVIKNQIEAMGFDVGVHHAHIHGGNTRCPVSFNLRNGLVVALCDDRAATSEAEWLSHSETAEAEKEGLLQAWLSEQAGFALSIRPVSRSWDLRV